MSIQNAIFFSKKNFINFLITFIPISYIAGNLILNINILILTIVVLFNYSKEISKLKIEFVDKFLIIIFLYIIINGIYNNFFNYDFTNEEQQNKILIKSLLYVRFLIFYYVLRLIIYLKLINYKLLFLVFGSVSLFVSADLVIQYFLGYNLLGFEGSGRRLPGIFKNEYIAGSFIQRFSFFAIFYILLFSIFKNKVKFTLVVLLMMILILVSLVFAGNRIPLIMFIFGLTLTMLFKKEVRKIFIFLLMTVPLSLFFLLKSNNEIHSHYVGFFIKTDQIFDYYSNKAKGNDPVQNNNYIKEIESGFATWGLNKYFGGGIKSFYNNCIKLDKEIAKKWGAGNFKVNNCPNHPHNYHVQILAELGLVGYLLFLFLFLYIFVKGLKLQKYNSIEKKLITPFLIILFIELFPIKTTGSFFTTSNSTFIFLFLAIIAGIVYKKKIE